ncbi:MAG: SDR family NAD(P)-dependent oxidoreductase [Bacteroidales bacterium]|jgi:NAD(P)-dependent dehydrogenase (short-subunit alcohol dehydrogenase family)|nr:SDR family NAD(P)-dependent oxidoreductase [Bacteroidales bacterium]
MISRYFKEYKWSNIAAMIRNNGRDPRVCTRDFKDKLVVISGATSGIGYHTARKFASHGARLLCINRNEKKSAALKTEIEKEFGVGCEYIIADLSNLKDIYSAAEKLGKIDSPIDVLIHNAGIYLTKRELTSEGFDKMFVVHHLASFVINNLLGEKLKSWKKARIILVNSEGHRFAPWGLQLDDLNWDKRRYSGLKSYGSAKLAQLLSMLLFAEYFKPWGVTINALHPGAVRSESGQENGPVYRWLKKHLYDKFLRPAEISAEAIYYLGVSDEIEGVTGKFFNLTTGEQPAPPALDKEAAYELWVKSVEMTGVKDIIS